MRIQSRVLIIIAASVLISVAIAFLIASILGDIRRDLSRSERFTDILNEASALNTLVYQFKERPTERTIKQLSAVNVSLGAMLQGLAPLGAREEFLHGQVIANYQELGLLLGQFYQDKSAPEIQAENERKRALVNQLRIKSRSITDDTSRLMVLNQERILDAQEEAIVLVLTLVGAVIFTNALVSYLSSHSIVREIHTINAGAKRIARGDLEHPVEVRGKNELAELAASFNEMTTALRGSYGELRQSNRELQEFTFTASHDLQEPLRKIQAFSNRLRLESGDCLNEAGLDSLARMENASKRMQELIDALLAYSRVSTRQEPLRPVNLNLVAEEVLGDLEARIAETKGRITVEGLPEIEADSTQMRQLFQNLFSNALKYHRPSTPPVVHVRGRYLDENRRMCELTVSDNGIGFDEKYLGKIFTPFQRLHGRKEFQGTGIGLTICRKIVERHKGMITARGVLGQGTSFIVTLPVKQEEASSSLWQSPGGPDNQ